MNLDPARQLGDGPSNETRARQRQRLLETAAPRRSRSRVLVPVFAIALVALVVFVVFRPAPLVRDDAGPIAPHTVLRAGDAAHTLSFAEKSHVTLDPGALATLEAVDATQVEMVLKEGHLDAEVTKGTGRTWRFHAGPWTVRVIGTHLGISFDGRQLTVTVTEGVVQVEGPGGSQLVHAGEQVVRAPPPPPTPTVPEVPDVRAPVDAGLPVVAPVRHAVAPPPVVPAPTPIDWKTLLAEGKRGAALDAFEKSQRLDQVSDADALTVADAARLERRVELARQLFTQVLAHDGADAAEAAFQLGRLESDAHRPDAARAFYQRSIAASSSGSFAEQSRGRLLETLLELADATAAHDAARDYLEHHPNGAWAALARTTLGDAR